MKPKYHNVRLRVSSLDSNALCIVGTVCAALRKAGVGPGEVEAFASDAMSSDYNHLLRTTMRWVKLVD